MAPGLQVDSIMLKFFFGVVLFTGCSQPKYGQPVDMIGDNGKTTYLFASEAEASRAASEYTLRCKTPGACPENVGTLVLTTPHSTIFSTCTFSLIADDIIITNRHCLADELAHRGVSCLGRIDFLLLQHGSADKSQIFSCDKVLSVPDEYIESKSLQQRDFAVIKIFRKKPNFITKDPRILPFVINQLGLPDKQKFHVIVTDPEPNMQLTATIREQTCTTFMSPYLYDSYASANDPVVGFENCKIIHGNSGSPVLDSEYKMRAILNELIDKKTIDLNFAAELAAGGEAMRLVHTDQYMNKKDLAGGINLSCVDIPELGLKLLSEQECIPQPKKTSQNKIDPISQPNFLKSYDERIKGAIPAINLAAPVFTWSFSQPSDEKLTEEAKNHRIANEFDPRCFNGIYDKFGWGSLVSTPDANGMTTYKANKIPADLVDADIDETLKLFVVYTTKLQNIVFKFNLNELVHSPSHSTKVLIERTGYLITHSSTSESSLGFCNYYITDSAK